jgi:tetratricopeptide (TPR) repeat protein
MNKAVVAEQQKDLEEAETLYDQAITIREKLIENGQSDIEDDLARVYVNKANLLSKQGKLDGAIKLYNRSIEIRERLVDQGREDLEDKLAASCVNKALVVRRQKDLDGAIALFNRAIKVYEKLIKKGRRELSSDRAQALAYRAKLTVSTHPDEARRDARLAISILETEVGKTRRADLKRLLAWAKKNLKSIL